MRSSSSTVPPTASYTELKDGPTRGPAYSEELPSAGGGLSESMHQDRTQPDDQNSACKNSVAVRHPWHREAGCREEKEKGQVGEERRLETPRPLSWQYKLRDSRARRRASITTGETSTSASATTSKSCTLKLHRQEMAQKDEHKKARGALGQVRRSQIKPHDTTTLFATS